MRYQEMERVDKSTKHLCCQSKKISCLRDFLDNAQVRKYLRTSGFACVSKAVFMFLSMWIHPLVCLCRSTQSARYATGLQLDHYSPFRFQTVTTLGT